MKKNEPTTDATKESCNCENCDCGKCKECECGKDEKCECCNAPCADCEK